MTALAQIQQEVGFATLLYDDQIGKVSLVGAGMRSHPGVSATLLRRAGRRRRQHRDDLDVRDPHLGGHRDDQLDAAVRAVHTAFDLDSTEVEAVVYGGTGR